MESFGIACASAAFVHARYRKRKYALAVVSEAKGRSVGLFVLILLYGLREWRHRAWVVVIAR